MVSTGCGQLPTANQTKQLLMQKFGDYVISFWAEHIGLHILLASIRLTSFNFLRQRLQKQSQKVQDL